MSRTRTRQPVHRSDNLRATQRCFSVAAVSFLNARPLIHGLADDPRVKLVLHVPAEMGRCLDDRSLDAALTPTIDIARARSRWRIIQSAGCIASDDETLTVRIFSRRPIEHIETLAVDNDSHTSIALAQVVLPRRFGRSPKLRPMDMRAMLSMRPDDRPDAVLLIGDKVVAAGPNDPESPWPVQADLGRAWRELTGLPFVFAAWVAPAGADIGDLPTLLANAKSAGLADRDRIAQETGPALGWPVELARTYLTHNLAFDLTPRRMQGMEKFFELATKDGLL